MPSAAPIGLSINYAKLGSDMARRVPIDQPDKAIQIIKEDGGVILMDFSSVVDVQRVNADAAPYIEAIVKDVKRPLCSWRWCTHSAS